MTICTTIGNEIAWPGVRDVNAMDIKEILISALRSHELVFRPPGGALNHIE